MGRRKNPFENREEETKDPSLLKIGQRVLIIEKHKQGTADLTDCYIVSLLTTKGIHKQGVKIVGLRRTFVENKMLIWRDEVGNWQGDQELIKQIGKVGTKTGDLDLNKFAIGRVQFLGENYLNIEPGDLVMATKAKKRFLERDKVEGIVMNIIQYEIVDDVQMTQVELMDGTIGWVQEIISKIED